MKELLALVQGVANWKQHCSLIRKEPNWEEWLAGPGASLVAAARQEAYMRGWTHAFEEMEKAEQAVATEQAVAEQLDAEPETDEAQ